jgi:hypothetical protein
MRRESQDINKCVTLRKLPPVQSPTLRSSARGTGAYLNTKTFNSQMSFLNGVQYARLKEKRKFFYAARTYGRNPETMTDHISHYTYVFLSLRSGVRESPFWTSLSLRSRAFLLIRDSQACVQIPQTRKSFACVVTDSYNTCVDFLEEL